MLCKNGFENPVFCQKPQNFVYNSLDHTIFFKFHQLMVQILINNVWRDFRPPMTALATVGGKSLDGKFTAKIDFPIGCCILPLVMLTLEV